MTCRTLDTSDTPGLLGRSFPCHSGSLRTAATVAGSGSFVFAAADASRPASRPTTSRRAAAKAGDDVSQDATTFHGFRELLGAAAVPVSTAGARGGTLKGRGAEGETLAGRGAMSRHLAAAVSVRRL